MRLLKLEDKYTGWSGEECWRPHGRRFIEAFRDESDPEGLSHSRAA